MKLIIIEGTDNTGKNTIISNLLNKYKVAKVVHCDKPKTNQLSEQIKEFDKLANIGVVDYKINNTDVLIHNRSWYGEYVYGCMYRNQSSADVKQMISTLEKYTKHNIDENDIFLITLLADNPAFLVKHDDGLSISDKLETKQIECDRFKEIFEYSSFKNKLLVNVNDGENFRPREEIWQEIENFIESANN